MGRGTVHVCTVRGVAMRATLAHVDGFSLLGRDDHHLHWLR